MRQFTTRPRSFILDLLNPKNLPRLPAISTFHCSRPRLPLSFESAAEQPSKKGCLSREGGTVLKGRFRFNRTARDDSQRVCVDKLPCSFRAEDCSSGIAAAAQDWGPSLRAMSIGRQEVDTVVTEQAFGAILRRATEFSCDAHRSQLNVHTLLNKFGHQGATCLDLRVAFRMNENWMHAVR